MQFSWAHILVLPQEETEQTQAFGKLNPAVVFSGHHKSAIVNFFLNCSPEDRINFQIKINDTPLTLLFDSGSDISCVNKTLVQSLNLNLTKTTPIILRMVNHSVLAIDEKVTVNIEFQNKTIRHDLYYYPELRELGILGIDFYNKASLCIINKDFLKPLGRRLKPVEDCFTEDESLPKIFYHMESSIDESIKFNIESKVSNEVTLMKSLLNKYKQIFATSISDLKYAKGIVHYISTNDAEPISQRNYRYGFEDRKIIFKQVEEWLGAGIIEEATSPWLNPIVLVKKDGKPRLCLDFRKLNAVTEVHKYPIPLVDECLDNISGCKFISMFDLRSGFLQIGVAEEDRPKTAFSTGRETYQFRKMPFGLVNAPSTFQKVMNHVFKEFIDKFMNVYIDDVVCYSKTFNEHLFHLEEIFKQLDKYNLKLHIEKSKFICEEVKFLGFIVNGEDIKPDPHRCDAINQIPVPTRVKELQSFLGSSYYYRRFIRNYSIINKPLTELLKKNAKWNWTQDCQNAFNTIKQALTTEPILALYRPGDQLILSTDASGFGVGAILFQIQDGLERVLYYASCTLNRAQQNYSTTERECYGIVWAIKKFRHYLIGCEFLVQTDHHGLCWLMSIRDPSGRLCRWSLLLQEYTFKIVYKSGRSHSNIDILSRNPLEEEGPNCDELNIFQIDEVNIAEIQKSDPWCKSILKRMDNGKLKPGEKYMIEDNILYRMVDDLFVKDRKLLCLPVKLQRDVIQTLHSDITSGHLGLVKTLDKIRKRFYFPQMLKIVRKYIQACMDCQSRKKPVGKPYGNLQNIISTEPFEICFMDMFGPLVKSSKGNRYVIVFTDSFTKYVELKAVKDQKAKTVADFFIHHIVLKHGAVERIVTDQAQSFCSEFMEIIYSSFASKHTKASPYHPQTNGQAERFNRVLADSLALFVKKNQKDWDRYVPYVQFAYNSARSESTQFSPFYLMHGREPRLPIDVAYDLPKNFIEDFDTRFTEARGLVKQNLMEARWKQKQQYDKRHRDVQFEVGQKVLIYSKTKKVGLSSKLLNLYYGPYVIIEKLGPVTYLCKDIRTEKKTKSHVSRMKIFYEIGDEEIWPFMTKKRTTVKEDIPEEDLEAYYGDDGNIPEENLEALYEDDDVNPGEDNTAV